MFDFNAAIASVQAAVDSPAPKLKRPKRSRNTPQARTPLSVMAVESLMVEPAIGTGTLLRTAADKLAANDLAMRQQWARESRTKYGR